jgi:ankyrin repeat protein
LQLASREGHIKIVELLLESGADVNAEGGEHGSAWRCASDSTHDEIADLLLKHGAIPSIRSQRASRRRATRAATQTKDEKHTKRMGNVDIMETVDSDEEDLVTAHSKLSVEGVIDLTED